MIRHAVLQKLFADFLPGKVCVITGGGRGVGQAIAEKYAAEGFTLSLTARSKDQLEEVCKASSERILQLTPHKHLQISQKWQTATVYMLCACITMWVC